MMGSQTGYPCHILLVENIGLVNNRGPLMVFQMDFVCEIELRRQLYRINHKISRVIFKMSIE